MSVYLVFAVIFSHADIFGKEIYQYAEKGDLSTHGPRQCASCPRLPGQGKQIQ